MLPARKEIFNSPDSMELADRFHLGGNCITTEKIHVSSCLYALFEQWNMAAEIKNLMICYELENNVFLPDIVKYSSH